MTYLRLHGRRFGLWMAVATVILLSNSCRKRPLINGPLSASPLQSALGEPDPSQFFEPADDLLPASLPLTGLPTPKNHEKLATLTADYLERNNVKTRLVKTAIPELDHYLLIISTKPEKKKNETHWLSTLAKDLKAKNTALVFSTEQFLAQSAAFYPPHVEPALDGRSYVALSWENTWSEKPSLHARNALRLAEDYEKRTTVKAPIPQSELADAVQWRVHNVAMGSHWLYTIDAQLKTIADGINIIDSLSKSQNKSGDQTTPPETIRRVRSAYFNYVKGILIPRVKTLIEQDLAGLQNLKDLLNRQKIAVIACELEVRNDANEVVDQCLSAEDGFQLQVSNPELARLKACEESCGSAFFLKSLEQISALLTAHSQKLDRELVPMLLSREGTPQS